MSVPKPTVDQIHDLYETIKGDWSDLTAQDKEMAALHEMTYDVPHPEPEIENFTPKVIRSGWTKRAIKSFVAMFADKPVAHHEPSVGAASHRLSERIEGILNTLPWAIEAKYGAFWTPNIENCGVFGRGWTEVLPKRKRWVGDPTYPQKGKGTDPETGKEIPANESQAAYEKRREDWKKDALPPVSIRQLPAESVYAIIAEHYRVLQAVRYAEITLAEAAQRWPEKFDAEYNNREENQPTEKVKFYEYVDEAWCAQAVEFKDSVKDFIIKPWRHGMPICPWVLIEGLTTASTDPNKRWEPYLLEIKDVGIAIDSQLTRKAMITQIWPMPQPHFRVKGKAPESIEQGFEFIELKPPQALVTYDDTEFQIIPWQGMEGEEDRNLLDRLQQVKDRALPDVGAEIAEGASDAAAWTWRIRGQMQERDMKTVVDNLSLSAKRLFQAILWALLSRWINETVYVGVAGKEGSKREQLSPKDIKGQINRINASIKTSKLIDRNSDLGAMKMAVEEPLKLGRRWAGENIGGIENIEEVLEEALLEELEFSDEFKGLLLQGMLEEADLLQKNETAVPPSQIASQMGMIPPSAQLAVGRVTGTIPPMQGLGASQVPVGAHPNTLTRTGVGTPIQGGPNPAAPTPGGMMPT